jgi:hypothetical protein
VAAPNCFVALPRRRSEIPWTVRSWFGREDSWRRPDGRGAVVVCMLWDV